MSAFRPLILVLALVALVATSLSIWKQNSIATKESVSSLVSGNADIGGPFTLKNQHGTTISDTQLRGKLMLVFFGFTFCPDICPTGLGNMTAAIKKLGSKGSEVTTVFITVDPERDTVSALKSYAENFDPEPVMLTGSLADIKKAADGYKVYFSKMEPNVKGAPYMVNHSGYIYLMDREGKYLSHFDYKTTPDKIAETIRVWLASEKK